jgi:hypothetical protein
MKKNFVFGVIFGFLLLTSLYACSGQKFPYGVYRDSSFDLTLNPDGKYTSYYPDTNDLVDQGTFSISGNQIVWVASSRCSLYFPGYKPATSTWTYTNHILVFKFQGADSCPDRQSVLNSWSWSPK